MTQAEKMKACRKELESKIYKTFTILDPDGVNTKKFKEYFKLLSDKEFIDLMQKVAEDPNTNLFFEMKFFETQSEVDRGHEAAKLFNLNIWDNVGYKDMTEDGSTVYSSEKLFIGITFIRKVSQTASNKNKMPKDVKQIDQSTGQVTGKSKAGRVSDMESYSLIAQEMPNVLKEMHGPRGGDPVAREEMLRMIASGEPIHLEDIEMKPSNKVSLNTASDILLAAGIESDLVNQPGYVLPRTKRLRELKGVKRK